MKKILIVDDEPDIIKTTSLALELERYQVIEAKDGEEALVKLRQENPDLVLLDVMLPGMSGLEVARTIKADKKYSHIPIILLTAFTQKHDEELLGSCGVDCYIKKPFELEELAKKIKELLPSG